MSAVANSLWHLRGRRSCHLRCPQNVRKRLPLGSIVLIYSNSKFPLQALESRNKIIPIIAKIPKQAFQIVASHMVSFHSVPRRKLKAGNEMTDREAFAAAKSENEAWKNGLIKPQATLYTFSEAAVEGRMNRRKSSVIHHKRIFEHHR